MDRFEWAAVEEGGGPVLGDGEIVLSRETGVRLYDGEDRTGGVAYERINLFEFAFVEIMFYFLLIIIYFADHDCMHVLCQYS